LGIVVFFIKIYYKKERRMNYRNIYWYFEKALSNEICDEILKIGIKKINNLQKLVVIQKILKI